MSQAFDKYEKLGAYHYDWYDDPNYAWYKECVDRCVEFCKGATIDVGCGDGLVCRNMQRNKLVPVIGIDPDPKGIDLAISNNIKSNYTEFRVCGIEDMSGVGVQYMVCLNVIEHLIDIEPIKNYIKNNIEKGAIIITDMPTENKGRYHEHEYTKKELLDTFKEFKPKYFVINSTEFGKPIQFHGVEIKK